MRDDKHCFRGIHQLHRGENSLNYRLLDHTGIGVVFPQHCECLDVHFIKRNAVSSEQLQCRKNRICVLIIIVVRLLMLSIEQAGKRAAL